MTEATERAAAQSFFLRLAPFAAPALVLLAIVVPFLTFYKYNPLLPESLVLIGGAVLLGGAVGALARAQRRLVPALMTVTLFVYVFFRQDAIALLTAATNALSPITGHPFFVVSSLALILTGVTYLVCVLLRRHLDTIVVAVFGTMIVSTIVLPVGADGEPVSTGALPKSLAALPPVIHIILDEHIGLAGLPADFEGSAAAKRIIPATYKDFALYSRAYSRFPETKYSLTSLMNRDRGADVTDLLEGDSYSFSPKENDWFDVLKQKGYAIRVYQSTWFDMCSESSAVSACYTYSMFSPNPIQRSQLSTRQRLGVLAQKLFVSPRALQLEPMVSLNTLARLRADIAEAPRGVAYIVHLLIPHHGYLYASDCSLRDPKEWVSFDRDGGYSAKERARLYRAYLGQLVCADKQMDQLFTELKELGVYDEATIVIHGDHGSRIGEGPFITPTPQILTAEDRLDHFSTLLAIKAPGVTLGIHEEPVVLQQIFAQTFLGGSLPTSPAPGKVFVRTSTDGESFDSIDFAWPDAPGPIADTRLNATTGG
jgi:Sulfatase